MTRLFARRKGRHCRHGSLTGWSALAPVASLRPVVEEPFSRRRTTPLAPYPMAADLYPYNPLERAS